ncbi:MAG: hypothetical protein R3B09_02670 [Nannocystaceae bacterium]
MSLGLAAAPAELPLEPSPAPDQPELAAPEPEPEAAAETEWKETPDEGDPPYYSAADMKRLRERHSLAEPTEAPRRARWRCLIADQTCSFNVEVNAMGAYAFRVRQDSVAEANQVSKWSSGRSQYDLWINLPAAVETLGDQRYTRLTLGPKGGLIVSDTSTIWGNIGLALRYWVNRGRWSPTIEFTSALVFKLADATKGREFQTRRSPVGITADVGVGLGGFGALVIGGQYDSPLAREDISDAYRVPSQGMFFLGFRGNIVWGAPAVVAVGTHALTQRLVTDP